MIDRDDVFRSACKSMCDDDIEAEFIEMYEATGTSGLKYYTSAIKANASLAEVTVYIADAVFSRMAPDEELHNELFIDAVVPIDYVGYSVFH